MVRRGKKSPLVESTPEVPQETIFQTREVVLLTGASEALQTKTSIPTM
jgi:hypothetical protein